MSDSCVEAILEECPVCGVVGLPERIVVHDCIGSDGCTAAQRRHVSDTEDRQIREDDATEVGSLNESKASRTIQNSGGEE